MEFPIIKTFHWIVVYSLVALFLFVAKTSSQDSTIGSPSGVSILGKETQNGSVRQVLASKEEDTTIETTTALSALTSIWKNTTEKSSILLPLYWHIPKSGGTAMKQLAQCLGLINIHQGVVGIAGNAAAGIDDPLKIVQHGPSFLVNVDISNPAGIRNAYQRGLRDFLISNILLQQQQEQEQDQWSTTSPLQTISKTMMATPLFQDAVQYLLPSSSSASSLLSNQTRFQMKTLVFALFRHPVERAVSLFYYLQHADWEPTYRPDLVHTTLLEFYTSPTERFERNWMTYYLAVYGRTDRLKTNGTTTTSSAAVTREDLDYAKRILDEYMLVALTDHMAESLRRLGISLQWRTLPMWSQCQNQYSGSKSGAGGAANAFAHPRVLPDSPEWKIIAEVNAYDMELYEYALQVFHKQSVLF